MRNGRRFVDAFWSKIDEDLRAELAAEVEARGLQVADLEPSDVAEIRAGAPRKFPIPEGVEALTGRECWAILARIGRVVI